MYTTRPLHFHIVCDEPAQLYLEDRLRLLTRPVHPITVRFYRLSFRSMMGRVAREGSINTDHSAGIRMLLFRRFTKILLTMGSIQPGS
jgi:hypothetical protein